MSHIAKIECDMTDEQLLFAALKDVYPDHQVEKHDEPVTVHDYYGKAHGMAHIVARRTMGQADTGFVRGEDGRFSATYDEMLGKDWLARVQERYQNRNLKKQAKRLGHTIVSETTEADGRTVVLELEV